MKMDFFFNKDYISFTLMACGDALATQKSQNSLFSFTTIILRGADS